MANVTKIDHITEGINRLIGFWRDKPKVVGLLRSYLIALQEIEDFYFQLLEERSLSSAIGAQLDNIGLLVGEERKGRSDTLYREAIQLRIAINTSDGTEPVVSSLLKQLSSAETLTYNENYPAGIIVRLEGPNVSISQEQTDEIKNILAATITAELEFVTFIDPPFVFRNDPDGEGFADVGTTSEFDLITDQGVNILLSTGNLLSVQNENIAIDFDSIPGGYLADNVSVTI